MNTERVNHSVSELLAWVLSSFDFGENYLTGKCSGDKDESCSVLISHKVGDGTSTTELTFKVVDKSVQVDSLKCALNVQVKF